TSNGNTLNIILSENTENGKVDVMDMAGRTVGSFNLNSTTTSLPMNVSTGVYLVRLETGKGTDTHRIVIK
ncbi:MAG: T9SS type A sorting domain-containing protein, partial [Flavobacteriales bacterium]|nr:T9SS type A sorting domain-containing protein [Flavobacteriales bacterium]